MLKFSHRTVNLWFGAIACFGFADLALSQSTPVGPVSPPNKVPYPANPNPAAYPSPTPGQYQPQIRIDAQQLINSQNQRPEKRLPPNPNRDYSNAAPNNVRIGSNGDYIDNSNSEQITSSGLICQSNRNSKKCN
jgi:hypothetical protein